MSAGELWPSTVSRLHAAGIKLEHRPGSHDIVAVCPFCFGRLILDEAQDRHHCFGDIHCKARHLSFDELVKALEAEAKK